MAPPPKDPNRWRDLIDRSGGPDACWPWIPPSNAKGGYGRIRILGKWKLVSRLVLADKLGRDLLRAEFATHECDNPPCCNPRHIVLGDATTNNREREARSRGRYGEVRARDALIYDEFARGDSRKVLAERHRLSIHTISPMLCRERRRREALTHA